MVDILLFTKSLWLQGENSTQMGTERKKKKRVLQRSKGETPAARLGGGDWHGDAVDVGEEQKELEMTPGCSLA